MSSEHKDAKSVQPPQSQDQSSNAKPPVSNNNLREDLIGPAVKFLSDPKVVEAPLPKKIAFLESKGLNGAEIEESIIRSRMSTFVDDKPSSPPPVVPVPSYHHQAAGAGLALRDMLFISAIIGTAGYGIYYAVKSLAADWLGMKDPVEEQVQEMSSKIDDMLAKVESSLEEVRVTTIRKESDLEVLRQELQDIKEMIPKSSETPLSSTALSDVQNEIRSLKSLLLNRRQFPPIQTTNQQAQPIPTTPSIKQSTADPLGLLGLSATVPSWQLNHQVKPCVDISQSADESEKENQSEQEA